MTRAHLITASIVGVIVLPLTFLLATAFADAETRRHHAPFVGLVGERDFTALLAEGVNRSGLHYYGSNRSAPDFALRDQSGRNWRLSDHRGKAIMMNVWSSTCQPCIDEMPKIERLAYLLNDREDVEIITVTTDPDWASIQHVFPRGTNLTVLFDPDKEIVEAMYGSRLFPETWFIDPKGIIRFRYDGSRDWSKPVVIDLIDSL